MNFPAKQTQQKKQASQNPGVVQKNLYPHCDLLEKLVIGFVLHDGSWASFAAGLVADSKGIGIPTQPDHAFDTIKLRWIEAMKSLRTKGVQDQPNHDLINALSKYLQLPHEKFTQEKLAQMSVAEFFELLSSQNKASFRIAACLPAAKDLVKKTAEKCGIVVGKAAAVGITHSNRIRHTLRPIYINFGKFEFCDGNRVDASEIQKFMYYDSNAVNNWGALIRDSIEQYPNYVHCLKSLNGFLSGPLWRSMIEDNQLTRTISLGAGTPEKDRQIVRSFYTGQSDDDWRKAPAHYIVDSSLYMLVETVRALQYGQSDRQTWETEIIPVSGDFLALRDLIPELATGENGTKKNTAFFMLGGTIGNINPSSFMESICHVAHAGDILVISAEFMPDDEADQETFREKLAKKYDHESAKRLVAPAAHAVLRGAQYAPFPDRLFSDKKVLDRIQVCSRREKKSHGSLRDILKMVFVYENPTSNIKFDVVEANRFLEKEFIDFINGYGFELIENHQDGTGEPKQLVFKKY